MSNLTGVVEVNMQTVAFALIALGLNEVGTINDIGG